MKRNEIEAKEFLERLRFTVLFSGGKDSTAALLWVLENVGHDDWNILYVEISGNPHELCTEYVYDVCERLGVAEKLIHVRTENFFDLAKRWGFPHMFYRWCLWNLKARAIREYSHVVTVTGIRAADSRIRKEKAKVVDFIRASGTYTVQPLLDWSKSEVYELLRRYDIPLNPCYEKFGHSGNCMFCPYHDKRAIIRTMSDPEWRAKILPILHARKDRLDASTVGRYIYEKWLRYSQQTVLGVDAE